MLARTRSQRSTLMSLPLELRQSIFSYALTSDKPLVTFHLDEYQREVYEEASQPALLSVSKQVRAESLLLYYQSNHFIFHSEGKKADDAEQWLQYALPYLHRLGSIVFWLRCMARAPYSAGPQGAIAIRMRYAVRTDCWNVADEWSWVSTVRQPEATDTDAEFLVNTLRQLMSAQPRLLSVDFVANIMKQLRKQYIDYKIH